jgi:nudix-type nucleoside diphosphatase (YffH/AdpP family)
MNAMPSEQRQVVIHRRRRILQDFFSVDEAELSYARYDGTMCGPVRRLSLERGDSVAVLLHERGQNGGGAVILVEQFRFPTYANDGGWIVETVAGMLDPDEPKEDAVRREVMEEVGYALHDVEYIATYYPSPGGSSERIFLFYGAVASSDAVAGAGGGVAAENEDVRVIRLDESEFFDRLHAGAFLDAKTIIAGMWLERRLRTPGRG